MKFPGIKISCLLIMFLVFTFFINVTVGQDIKFELLTAKDGLSNSYVNCIVQDQVGFVWFGTDDGLNRYDGYEIKVYRNIPGDSSSLSDNVVWSMLEDHFGFMWIGTKGGKLNRYDPSLDKFEHWDLDSGDTREINITFLAEDNKNSIWIGTYRHGLYRFDRSQNRIDNWHNEIVGPKILSDNYILSILEDDDNNLWVSTYSGLNKYVPGSHRTPFSQITNKNFKVPLWYMTKSTFYKSSLWIGKLDGLVKFNPATEEYSQITLPASPGLQFGNSVSSLVEEEFSGEKILWVGTYGGLVRNNLTTGESERFIQNKLSPSGLLSNQINDLIIDKSGVVWVATDNGLNFYSPKRSKFNFPISRKVLALESDALKNGNIRAVSQTIDGTLWFGLESGLFGIKNMTEKSSLIRSPDLESLNIWTLFSGNSSNLWIGTYGQGLKELNIRSNIVKSWNVNNSAFNASPYYYIKSLLQDDNGMLWIGFWGGGLARLNPLNNKIDYWRHEESNPESLSFNDIWAIHKDRKGRLWVGTNGGGLNLFVEDQNSFLKWKTIGPKKQTLSSDNIFTICESAFGNNSNEQTVLWIGTAEGLNKFVIKNEKENHNVSEPEAEISYYTVEDGLPDNAVESILEDENGNLWIGTSSSMSFFNVKTEQFTNYGAEDGLNNGSFNSGAGFKTNNGILLFGSTAGLNFFDPKKISHSSYLPPVLITDFQIFNQPANMQNEFLLEQSIFNTEKILLNYNQNDFSFQFASLDYNAPEDNQYAYKLEGFDKDWIYSGTRRFVTYTNLDPGEYIFRIKATNSDGVWKGKATPLAIKILPPIWATWWAYLVYMLMFVSSLAWIRSAEIKRRKKKEEERFRRESEAAKLREAKLKAITIEQEKELEQQKIRNRIAQDLHDEIGSNLSSISLMSELIQKDGKINSEVFEKIRRIQKVALGSSQAMRDIVWLTNPSSDNIKDLISKMNEVANDMLGNMIWKFDFPKNVSEINLVPETKRNVFFIYKESLNNILRHSGANIVDIIFTLTNNSLSLMIKDDGKGFNTTSRFTGNGLKNLQSRAKEINGILKINSASGKGTSLELEVKITQVRD